ncbi:MAG: methyltransferase [Bacteroidaceae bacterium]|nr:methyltransferase [Bacteroidaceae bacterium]
MSSFTFKQFAINQERCAMKVGTDGVLLGAWARVAHCRRVLDIGTGTGLVALMAAQRSQAHIVAIDLDADAVAQATANVAASPWPARIQVMEVDAREIDHSDVSIQNSEFLFDAILCNPPFFENALKSPDAARTMARHTDTLSFDELARSAARLLSPEGELSVIIPYDRAHDMTVSAACQGLFATRQTIVIPVEGGKPKRMLMAFSREGQSHRVETLCIHDAQRCPTADYVSLVSDFYLKM